MRAHLGAVLVLAAVGCGQEAREYTSAEGGFSVRLPGTPRTVSDPEQPEGLHQVRLAVRSGTYTVAWQDLGADAAKDSDERLDRACNGALRALGARQVSRKAIRLGEHPGREVLATLGEDERRVRARLYLVEGRLYLVLVTGARGFVDSGEADRFLESFRLARE
jgi:hypothetical protein